MKKVSNIFVSACFLLFIFLAMLVTITGPKTGYSFYENRRMSPFPEFSVENVADGSYFSQLDACITDQAALRETCLKIRTAADLYLLRRPVVNDVVITEDVLLPYLPYMHFDEEEKATTTVLAQAFVAEVLTLQQFVEDYGAVYYYVGVPCQYTFFEDRYPWFLEDRGAYTETILTAFAEAAADLGVHYIDMGPLSAQMENPLEFSSPIDNHYSLKGAYYTYEKIIEALQDDHGLTLSFPGADDIRFHELPNLYLGSRTRKLLNLQSLDDKLLYAEFSHDIPFARTDDGVLVDSSVYSFPQFDYEQVPYTFYMSGDIGETVISTNRPDLPSVLVYGDSFTNALECLLYYSFDEMRSIDLRHYDEMALSEYIALYEPDVVLCIRDYEALILPTGNGDVFPTS